MGKAFGLARWRASRERGGCALRGECLWAGGEWVLRWRINRSALAAPQIPPGAGLKRPRVHRNSAIKFSRYTPGGHGTTITCIKSVMYQRGHDEDSSGIYTCVER